MMLPDVAATFTPSILMLGDDPVVEDEGEYHLFGGGERYLGRRFHLQTFGVGNAIDRGRPFGVGIVAGGEGVETVRGGHAGKVAFIPFGRDYRGFTATLFTAFFATVTAACALVAAIGEEAHETGLVSGHGSFQAAVHIVALVVDSIVETPLQVAVLHASGTVLARQYGGNIFGCIGCVGIDARGGGIEVVVGGAAQFGLHGGRYLLVACGGTVGRRIRRCSPGR